MIEHEKLHYSKFDYGIVDPKDSRYYSESSSLRCDGLPPRPVGREARTILKTLGTGFDFFLSFVPRLVSQHVHRFLDSLITCTGCILRSLLHLHRDWNPVINYFRIQDMRISLKRAHLDHPVWNGMSRRGCRRERRTQPVHVIRLCR